MKRIFTSLVLLGTAMTYAQDGNVGINIEKPTATLNVKSKTGTDGTTTNLQLQNANNSVLMKVLDNGNVGISATTPTQKLDVDGNARIRKMVDATSLESTYTKSVVADANGNLAIVSRTTPTIPNSTQTIFGKKQEVDVMPNETFTSIQNNYDTKGAYYMRYAGQSITLPPGKWIVYGAYLVQVSPSTIFQPRLENNQIYAPSVWFRGIISENSNNEYISTHTYVGAGANISDSPTLISNNLSIGQLYSVASGLWFVDNNTSAEKTYYLKVSITPLNFNSSDNQKLLSMGRWGEDYLIAIRRQ